MEVFVFLLLIIILILAISIRSKVTDLETRMNEQSDALSRIGKELLKRETAAPAKPVEQPIRTEAAKPPVVPEQRKAPEPVKPEVKPPVRTPEPVKPTPPVKEPVLAAAPPAPPKPGFLERNPDLEKFIGENLANKIGIAILVIGIGFFVKYAIDQNWINEIGRVLIGVLCGGVLLGIAHKLRKKFVAFSSVLVGGGIAVLYFTIAIAFHEYGIFTQTAAFIIMVVITAFAVALSLAYNRIELAVLALFGGFGSPFMVSTGDGNYVVLFTYMLILNAGMLVLSYYKKWTIINIICYVFTVIIFGGWMTARFDSDNSSMVAGALIFATIFYLVFFVMNVINNIRQRTQFVAIEITILLSNTFLYYAAGMNILNNDLTRDFQGLFTALLGVFNFVFAFLLYKNQRVDRNLVFMLIGLVLTFISLAAPIQLEGNYITLFWSAEAVLLLWLSQKSGIKLMAIASVVVQFLMIISLLMDWKQIYGESTGHLTIVLNKGFITSVVALASLVLTYLLLSRERKDGILRPAFYQPAMATLIVVFTYFTGLLELRHQALFYADTLSASIVIVGCYNMLAVLLILTVRAKLAMPEEWKPVVPFLGVIAMVAYLLYYHGVVVETRSEFLSGTASATGFIFHYLMIALLLASVLISLKKINSIPELALGLRQTHWWFFIFFFVFVASAELDHAVVLAAFDGDNRYSIISQTHRIGFPILWGFSSFILIAIGLKKKIKVLRIISLVLLLITLLKLFIFDLRDISEAGKIAAFISLGVLLLVVSFMYQRLKKLLLEDSTVKQTP